MKQVFEKGGYRVFEKSDRYVVMQDTQYGMTGIEQWPLTNAGLAEAIDTCECYSYVQVQS